MTDEPTESPEGPPQTDATPEPDFTLDERQTIQQILQAQLLLEQEERRAAERADRKRREESVQARRQERVTRQRASHARRVQALGETTERVNTLVGTASGNLRAALRAATELTLPRHTAEGREQQRIVQSLEAALGALRRVGRGTFHETEFDPSAEADIA